jgi:hypothetical protein
MVATRSGRLVARFVAVVVVSLATFVLLVQAVELFFQVASPRPGNPGSQMPATIALPMLLTYLTVGLIATRMATDRYGNTLRRAGSGVSMAAEQPGTAIGAAAGRGSRPCG